MKTAGKAVYTSTSATHKVTGQTFAIKSVAEKTAPTAPADTLFHSEHWFYQLCSASMLIIPCEGIYQKPPSADTSLNPASVSKL